jgi:Trk-type K+ transport system membrane component
MWFYKQEIKKSVLAGSETELKLKVGVLFAWLFTILVLVGLAIYAHATQWEAGSTSIFSLASGITGVGLGSIIGEKKGADSAKH